jgi:transcription-repair coupling factor (superfamily II helicase)
LEPVSQEVNLHVGARIPEDYLPDVHARLILYKRIANAQQESELDDLLAEVVDRFGRLPEPLKQLFRVTALKLRMQPLGIKRLDLGSEGGKLEFNAGYAGRSRAASCTWCRPRRRPSAWRGHPAARQAALPEFDQRMEFATELLERLTGPALTDRAVNA